jgi:PAS domain S-box-containing protein
MKAIKAEGGVTFAQDETSARFQDMPRAAIAAGSVDFVLPPEGIARELAQIGRHPYVALPPRSAEPAHAGTAQETRNSELTVLNDDLSNLLAAISVPIVMIGLDGRIRRFTQPAEKLFSLIATDVGRPFRDIKHNVAFSEVDETIQQVMDTVTTREREVQDRDGRWYQMRIRPYWTLDKRMDGAVLVLSDIDPIKKSLEEVIRAREFADLLIETVRESLVVLDDAMNVRRANQSFYATFQESPERTEGRPLFEWSDWTAKAGPLLAQARENSPKEGFTSAEVDVDFEVLGKKTLLLNARRIPMPGEPGPLILLAIEDVTEKRDAEALLRTSEGRYRQLFESAREGILIVDAETGAALDVNPFLLQLVGFERDEVLEKKPWELPFAADPEMMRRGFDELTANNYAFDPDLELRKKGGGAAFVEALSSAYYLGRQKVAQYNLRDITARREAEREARRQKEFTGRVVDSSLDGILAFDRDENLIVWNTAMERIFGVRREAALGRNAFEVLPFFEEIGEPEYFRKAMEGEASVSEDRPYVSQTGREGFFEGHYSPLRDESGSIIGGLAVIREITSRKQFEEHLRQVQKLESLGTLSGGIAHDFNNLLNIISAYAALLAKDSAKKTPAHLEAINKAVDRGAALVRQLLTFARKSEVQFETVEPNAVAEELRKLLRETLPRKFEVAVELAPELPQIAADPNQLHQALLNLCVNARDAMPTGGKLRIRTSLAPSEEVRRLFSEATDTDYVLFSVKDSGGGIDEETRARLFEPFFTTKEKGRGAGLGLALVYGIVKSHLGFIDVESQVGRGSEFRIYLPVESGQVEESRPRARARRETPVAQGGSETILFAEDEEMLASAVKTLLESGGYRVLTAKDGQEALEIYRREGKEIAISILDLQMPRLGGWEAFQKLREMDPQARIVIASGDLDRQQRLEMENAGMDASLRKPYSAGQVMRTVRRILDR